MTSPSHRGVVIRGNWRIGWALDLHTLSSRPLLGGGFDPDRTEIGRLLFQLKYRGQRSNAEPLAKAAADFLQTRVVLPYLAAIIPVPPSNMSRPFQPVHEIANRIGRAVGLPVLYDHVVKTRATRPLKDITDPEERIRELRGAFRVKDRSLKDKRVLVFDDIYDSGQTLWGLCDALVTEGGVPRDRLYVLTLTKTRASR